MKKLTAVLLAAVLASAAFAAPAKKATKTANKAKNKVEILVVEDDNYAAGKEDAQLTAGLAQFLEAEPNVTKVSYAAALKDPKLAQMDYSFLPLYLIKKTAAVRAKLEKHIQ